MTDRTETDAAVQAGRLSADPVPLDDGTVYAISTLNGVEIVDRDTPDVRRNTRPHPNRKTGSYRFLDAASFAAYINDHGEQERTELFADRDNSRIRAILNGHQRGANEPAGWEDHRAVLKLEPTPEWTEWTGRDGKWMSQTCFAEFVEDHLREIREPAPALMLELAQTIEATKGCTMKSSVRLDNGQTRVRYEETIDTKAGAQGDLVYPTELTLGLAPFDGADTYKVTARLRHRISEGQLRLCYVLDRPRDAVYAAFSDVANDVRGRTGLDVLYGTPAPSLW